MRMFIRGIWAVGLWLGLSMATHAQTSLGEFGGYPSGITAGAPRGAGYTGWNPGGYVGGSSNPTSYYYGSGSAVPRPGGYSTSTPGIARPTYSYRPGVRNSYGYSSGYYAPGTGLRTATPGTAYYPPGTVTHGALTPHGYSTYISPTYGGYVMPRRNSVWPYVR